MITYKIHLLRTGRTSTETLKRYVGQSDPALCAEGIDELERMREEMEYPRVQMVFTSPLRRCVQTADLLYPNTYTEELDSLMDMNLGAFEGKTFEELRDDRDFQAWLGNSAEHAPPGGEETMDFTRRIVGAVGTVFDRMMAEKLTSVAVVTHGGVIMSLLAGIGLPKASLQQWAVQGGMGYTLLFTPQMWMRDGCAEVFAQLPAPAPGRDEDPYERYFNEG